MLISTRFGIVCFSCLLISLLHANASANPVNELEKRYSLMAPNGPGPFPTIVMFSGGSGFDTKAFAKHYDVVQKRLVDLGYLTVRMDVLGAIGAKNSSGVSYSGVASDSRSAIEKLKQDPKVKADELHLMGWSFGAAIALEIVSKPMVGIKSVFAYYPPCARLGPWKTNATVEVFYGEADTITPPGRCDYTFAASDHGPGSAKTVYPGAIHLFDFEHLVEPILHSRLGKPMQYQEAAHKKSWNIVVDTLKR